jgi:hypothetical protein
MASTASRIAFEARLQRPATPKNATWAFLVLPQQASARLPSRSMVSIEGRLGEEPFTATLEPDGQGGHWLKVPRALREAAGVAVGDHVTLDIVPAAREPEARVPADLRQALAAQPGAKAKWDSLTPVARRDWIQWLDSSKKEDTRARRIASSCDMLLEGKRRVCCFDRSGKYSKAFCAPEAAD